MNSKFFVPNVYGDIRSNPYMEKRSVRFQRELTTDVTNTSFLNKSEREMISIVETSRTERVDIHNDYPLVENLGDRNNYNRGVFNKTLLPIRYQRSVQRKEQVSKEAKPLQNLTIQPIRSLNSKVKLSKSRQNGIHLSESSKRINLQTSASMLNSHIEHDQNSYRQLAKMDHLAWQKCTLQDNRCLGFNFKKELENQVTVCFKGHVKRNYL